MPFDCISDADCNDSQHFGQISQWNHTTASMEVGTSSQKASKRVINIV